MIEVTEDWCKGCEICVRRCPREALEWSDRMNKRGIHPPRLKENNDCNFCRLCELLCPDFAITVIVEERTEPRAHGSKLIIGGIVHEV